MPAALIARADTLAAPAAVGVRQPGEVRQGQAEQLVSQQKQGPQRSPGERRYPAPAPCRAPAPERGIDTREPLAAGAVGVPALLQLFSGR